MAIRRTRTGKAVSPYHASKRYGKQLKNGKKKIMGPDGKLRDKALTKGEKAWRAGYVTAVSDSAIKHKEVTGQVLVDNFQ